MLTLTGESPRFIIELANGTMNISEIFKKSPPDFSLRIYAFPGFNIREASAINLPHRTGAH